MLATVLYEDGDHRWIMFARDPGKPDGIIDTNQYLIQSGKEAILLIPVVLSCSPLCCPLC